MQLQDIIANMDPISIDEMDSVKLMNRTDTKFGFSASLLPEILKACSNDYRILEVNTVRASAYRTLYFDTPDHQLYLDHHKGKPYRFKIRIRNYIESNLFYLEVKVKVKGRTVKSRIKLSGFETELSEKSKAFIEKATGEKLNLVPVLWNGFHRVTLVNRKEKERLTIDFGLNFENMKGEKEDVGSLIIAEVKQENRSRSSKIINVLRQYGIRESGMSKYCVGTALIEKELKSNNFKSKLLAIEKIKKAA